MDKEEDEIKFWYKPRNSVYLCVAMAGNKNINPFANKDGTVKRGFEKKFFEFERKKELEKRKPLPAAEQKALSISEKKLADRMAS